MAKAKASENPFYVRMAGNYVDGEDKGAIKGFLSENDADEDADARNANAVEMGLKARYEVVCVEVPA